MNNDLNYELIKPDKSINKFVESFWLLQNLSESDKEIMVLPDGRIDLILKKSDSKQYQAVPVLLAINIDSHKERVFIRFSIAQ